MNKFIVYHPLITEKATRGSALGKYVFRVANNATAPEVVKAILVLYKVHAENIHMIIVKPKRRRLGRIEGVKQGYKKAIITLRAGEKLDVLPHA